MRRLMRSGEPGFSTLRRPTFNASTPEISTGHPTPPHTETTMTTETHAILYQTADGTLSLGMKCKTPECAAESVPLFEGAQVLGTVALLPEPVSGMSYRLAAQPLIAELGQEVGAVESVWMFRCAGSRDEWMPFVNEKHRLNTMRSPEWEVREFTSPAHTSEARDAVVAELERAVRKFPTWPTDPLHAVAVLGEEFGELTKAVLQSVYEPHKVQPGEVRAEAVQTAAMAMRFLQSLDAYVYAGCEQHSQDAAMRQEGGTP